jgi:hypothetical protein
VALITNKATLKTAVAGHLNRTEATISDAIDIWIQLAEQDFQRDERVREPGSNNAVLVSIHTTDPNWLLTAEPDIYLFGVLVQAELYLKNYDRVPVWAGRLETAISKLAGSVRLNPARTLALDSYANLQTVVADALQRGDLKNVVPILIQLAERKLGRDIRVQNLDYSAFSIAADGDAVPSGFRSVEAWTHDGTSYYHPIEIVSLDRFGQIKSRFDTTGAPRAATVIDGTFRYAPAPDTTYATKMVFKRTVPALSSGVNWLFTAHPDLYLKGAIAEAGPWVRGDVKAEQTVAEAKADLEFLLEQLHQHLWEENWSGSVRKQFDPIG